MAKSAVSWFARALYAVALASAACNGGGGGGGGGGVDAGSPIVTTPPDPRFKWVDAYPSYDDGNETGGDCSLGGMSRTDVAFSPAAVYPRSAGYCETYSFAPTGVALAIPAPGYMGAYGSPGDTLDGQIATSFAFWSDGSGSGYVTTYEPAPAAISAAVSGATATFDATVADYISQGIVTTAIAFDGSAAELFGYGAPSDATTYEAATLTGSAADVPALASQLAGSGYIITAFGPIDVAAVGSDEVAQTFGLVGTRVAGSAAAHDATVVRDDLSYGSGSAASEALFAAGYVPVGGYFSDDASQIWFIFEK